jgi:putative transposase
LKGNVAKEVEDCIRSYCEQSKCIIMELNIQEDHIHLLIMIPPKVSISKLMGLVKGKTAIRVFKRFPKLKNKPYWGNHFWARGYCVDTVGLDEEVVRKYVKYQEEQEKKQEI